MKNTIKKSLVSIMGLLTLLQVSSVEAGQRRLVELQNMDRREATMEVTKDIKFKEGVTTVSVGSRWLTGESCSLHLKDYSSDRKRIIKKGKMLEISRVKASFFDDGKRIKLALYNNYHNGTKIERDKNTIRRYDIFFKDSGLIHSMTCLAKKTKNKFHDNGAPMFNQSYYIIAVRDLNNILGKLEFQIGGQEPSSRDAIIID